MSSTVHRLNVARLCNEAVDDVLGSAEKALMMAAAAQKLAELFDVLHIDHRNDHNMRDTPRRVAKMFVEEILHGRYNAPPQITEFENVDRYDQLIVTGPIEVRSMCAHHLMPIFGQAFIGVLPSPEGKIIGLSKYDRIVSYFGARLQIQEELVNQIGNFIHHEAARAGGEDLRRAHVQDPPRRARELLEPDGQQRLLRRDAAQQRPEERVPAGVPRP